MEKILKAQSVRLLVVSQYFWPENFRINDLVSDLSARGHHITVLSGVPNYPGGEVFPAFLENPEHYDCMEGVSIVRVPILTRGTGRLRLFANYVSFAISATLVGAWKLRRHQFDAVLVYEPSPITVGIPGAVLSSLKRAPMILWVLDLWPETLRAVGVVKSDWLLGALGIFVSAIYRRCTLIWAQSRSFVGNIRAYAGARPRITYFPNWAETVFDDTSIEPASEITPAPEAFTIMFAGNVGEAQDFPAVLAAAEALRTDARIRWLIVGDGRALAWLEKEIRARALQERVFLLGRHPLERMPAFFRHADAMLVSLRNDPIFSMTIPGKMQSYLAAGIPVLGMLNGEGAAVLNLSGAGLVCDAGDSAGLTRIVQQMADMPGEARRAMGQRARDYYRKEFERTVLLDRAEKALLDEVANANTRHGGGAT